MPEPGQEPLLEPGQEPQSPGAAIEQAAEQAAEAHQAAAAAKAEAPPGEAGKQDSLWRHRDFMLLWGGQTVSEMGSSVTQLALPLTAVVLLKASTFEVALLTSAATAAFALIALPAGAIVDRHAKRGIMLACDAARVLIIGWVPLAWALGVLMLWQLYVVALAAGVATVFFDVSYQSYLPVLLKPENLMDGNGKLGATQAFAQFTGPGLGGGLVGAVGAATAMWADAISYVVSVASLFGIRTREQRRRASAGAPQPAGGDRRGPEVRGQASDPAQDRRLHGNVEPVQRHVHGHRDRLPDSRAARPPRLHRRAVRDQRDRRHRRRSLRRAARPAHRLGAHHLGLHPRLRPAAVPAGARRARLAGGAVPDRLRHRCSSPPWSTTSRRSATGRRSLRRS